MTGPVQKCLIVIMGGQRVGTVTEDAGSLMLEYDDTYRANGLATPLSLSMPLSTARHDDRVVRAFLWGLLPDNERVLERWARDYQVSARNPFALLSHVGADCAGAAQFVPPDEVERLGAGGVHWIDETEIAHRLRTLRTDPTAWHLSTTGQFSLAGAQAKTALFYDRDARRWGDATGAVPTTHIIKPAIIGLDDHDLNEHICLQAATALGFGAAQSMVTAFADERAIVVERYDRLYLGDAVRRIHQEDMCQALGMPPTAKYESEGGPTAERIVRFIRECTGPSADAALSFVDALAFNWIIAGTDAHAKNYSVLLSGAQVRLAPLYDVASALPYDGLHLPRLRMAMRIGGEYRVAAVGHRHWIRLAQSCDLDPDEVVARARAIAERAGDAFAEVVGADSIKELGSDLPARLLDRIARHAQACIRALSPG